MNIEKQIEFDLIKEMWKELAITDYAKSTIDGADIILSENELRKSLKDTTDARAMIEQCGNPPIQNVTEVIEILESAGKGQCLTAYQLERVAKVLVVFRRFSDYLSKGKVLNNSLAYYDENFEGHNELSESISSQIRNDEVDDYASKQLHQIRMQIQKCDEQMRQAAEQTIRSNKAYIADSFYTTRNGRICIPVKKEYKLKFNGAVIDKSSTGSTLFIEPTSVSKLYEKLQLLKLEEENEVSRILYTLTGQVADEATGILEKLQLLERLDFLFSKGKLSIDLNCCEPKITLDRYIKLEDAWHPLMDREKAVPLQFEIGRRSKGIVITGPNTGGKTVAIKTVMLNCIMAQCGLHVTCRSAEICMNSNYLCDIGDGQSLSENLSTFSAHISNVLSVLEQVNENSFVIMDELGSGTDPTEGMGIAISILEELRECRALFLVTTHYPEVKEYAAKTDGLLNARMSFDRETLRPTYQMIIGEAGESCAFYIADRLGMPNRMLRRAITAAYGEEASEKYHFQKEDAELKKIDNAKIIKTKKIRENSHLISKYNLGDCVMILSDRKLGIVCEKVNEKGVLRVQLQGKKIWINHKRVKLHVAADKLYPEDYDFSIIFESVENRKKLHDMQRKLTDEVVIYEE